jgi:hypothetical protein
MKALLLIGVCHFLIDKLNSSHIMRLTNCALHLWRTTLFNEKEKEKNMFRSRGEIMGEQLSSLPFLKQSYNKTITKFFSI